MAIAQPRHRGALLLSIALLAPIAVSGCASPHTDDTWSPPAWPSSAEPEAAVSVHVLAPGDDSPQPDPTNIDLQKFAATGSRAGRIRNDLTRVQARYVEIPGATEFNTQIRDKIRHAASASDSPFVPEAFDTDAKLGERGCLAGVTTRDAAKLLADAETGPTGGTGTSLVCEITAAFGTTIGVGVRTVTGSPTEISSDITELFLVDVQSGELIHADSFWRDDAAAQLWHATIATLRRNAGGLSAAPIAAPNDEQLALMQRALTSADLAPDGSAILLLPQGITAPELTGLNVPESPKASYLSVDAQSLKLLQSDSGRDRLATVQEEFSGLPAWRANEPVDCTLVTCVAVTYDDGPSEHTPALLEALSEAQAPATFFMLGSSVRNNPDAVRAAAEAGFELGSHSMTHTDLTTLKQPQARAEIVDTEQLITNITGIPVRMYRPPYGAINDATLHAIDQSAVMWTVDTLDWKDPGVDELLRRSADAAGPGDIILFHDTHPDSVSAASPLIQRLRDRGFTPVTVSGLFGGNVPNRKVFSQ